MMSILAVCLHEREDWNNKDDSKERASSIKYTLCDNPSPYCFDRKKLNTVQCKYCTLRTYFEIFLSLDIHKCQPTRSSCFHIIFYLFFTVCRIYVYLLAHTVFTGCCGCVK